MANFHFLGTVKSVLGSSIYHYLYYCRTRLVIRSTCTTRLVTHSTRLTTRSAGLSTRSTRLSTRSAILSIRSTRLSTRSICLSTRGIRSTICRSLTNPTYIKKRLATFNCIS